MLTATTLKWAGRRSGGSHTAEFDPTLEGPTVDRPALQCQGVEVAYDKVQVLFGVDIEVQPGEIVALLGTNGAGKSTLLRAVSGLVHPVRGRITLEGRDITHADPVSIARQGVVHVPGGRAVFPTLSVAEHFKVATWLFASEPARDIGSRMEQVLGWFPRLRDRWDQMAGNLSGGEQQQLALGMAFVARPRLLVIDELSLGLAPAVVEQLLEIVHRIHARGCTVLIVEQSVNIALTLAQRAYFLEKGQVRFSGPTADLLGRTDVLRSVFLEGAVTAVPHSAPASTTSRGRSRRSPAGAGEPASLPDRRVGAAVLEVSGLTKRFGGIRAVNDVSFRLLPNEIIGLIGPNGAGKTTIFDLISGLIPADGGRIHLQGVDVTLWPAHKRASAGLGRCFQDARIFPSLSVAENIALGLERHIPVRDHAAAVLGLPAIKESEEDVAYTVDDLVELLNLGGFRDKFVSELSTGSRRIVDLAMAIAHDPTVLILDEPSSGIAQRETEALVPLLERIRTETGCSMLVIEHDMPLITAVSDQLLALELGAVLTQGPCQEVITDPRVVASYLGGDVSAIHRSGTAEATANPSPDRPAARPSRTAVKRPGRTTRQDLEP